MVVIVELAVSIVVLLVLLDLLQAGRRIQATQIPVVTVAK
jgi:hypothetical protein